MKDSGTDAAIRTDALIRAAQIVEEQTQAIHRTQLALTRQMSILQAAWSGPGSVDFARAYRTFDTQFEKVKETLDDLHDHLLQQQRGVGGVITPSVGLSRIVAAAR